MSRLVIGSRAALIAALSAEGEPECAAAGAAALALAAAHLLAFGALAPPPPSPPPLARFRALILSAARAERVRALREELFLDALFIVAQFPGGQIPEAAKCCYAYDVRLCAGLCRATWAEEAFWCGLARVQSGPTRRTHLMYASHKGDAARAAWLARKAAAPLEAVNVCASAGRGGRAAAGGTPHARARADPYPPFRLPWADGETALVYASWCCALHKNLEPKCARPKVVEALIKAGANVNAAAAPHPRGRYYTTAIGRTSVAQEAPLHFAAESGNVEIARMLLAAGAAVGARDSAGATPLHRAAAASALSMDILRVLIEAGAKLDAASNDGATPAALLTAKADELRALAAGAAAPAALAGAAAP